MKTVFLVIFSLFYGPISVLSTNSDSSSAPMFIYDKYDLQISFENNFRTYENNPKSNKNYFYQAIEVVVFDEDNREFHPDAQRLMNSAELFSPLQMLSLDTLDIGLDPKPELDTNSKEAENYNSLTSDFGESSSLYILPELDAEKSLAAAQKFMNEQTNYQLSRTIETKHWEDKKGLIWRAQLGKTRLDHYLVFGHRYNYLFVSSPYSGANGVIEKIILNMKISE